MFCLLTCKKKIIVVKMGKLSKEIKDAIKSLDKLQKESSYEDWKMRFAEHKERFKLLGLYNRAKQLETAEELELESEAEIGNPESAELTAIRNYLEPLNLAPEGTALSELARLAAIKITEK
jgi:hypothetical protein